MAGDYRKEWRGYLDSVRRPPAFLSDRLRTQYQVAVMTIKAHEDKSFRGAFIASLTLPWGFAVNADEGGGGYHFVWARDLYHQATAMLAAGDRAAADRAVTWLFTHQQQADGTFPQNSRVSGEPDQRNIQLDETAFPIVLAWQLGRTDTATWEGVRKAADALVRLGPSTPQERWEETGGFSPSTTASEIAGLVAAADLAGRRGDTARQALWLGVADAWQRSTEEWMFTTTGPLGDGRYYVRIDDDGDPDDDSGRQLANGAGFHLDKEVVDAGFLELVRLGVKAPDDPSVLASLPETDAALATATASGTVYKRYRFDGYGERPDGSPWDFGGGTIGRPWPLLTGERGEFEVARGADGTPFLQTMANTANEGFMIPEQVWDAGENRFGYVNGKATGSASPLAWAMAQYTRLARAIENGRPIETPAVVHQRYVADAERDVPLLELSAPEDLSTADAPETTVRGTTDADRVYVGVGGAVTQVTPVDGAFETTVPLKRGGNLITVVAVGDDGGTNMRQATVVSFGTRVGGFTDPAGDDNGPGTYMYPTCGCFNAGAFDLTALDVYTEGDDVLLVARIAGEVLNPFGGDQISLQRLNVYLGSAPDGSRPALPGTNMDTAEPWQAVVVGDGRFDQAGVYGAGRQRRSRQPICWPSHRRGRSRSPSRARRSAGWTSPRRSTERRCSETPRRARASASCGPCTRSTTGTTRPPGWNGSSSSGSAAAPASSTSPSPARTPTPATRMRWTSSSAPASRRRRCSTGPPCLRCSCPCCCCPDPGFPAVVVARVRRGARRTRRARVRRRHPDASRTRARLPALYSGSGTRLTQTLPLGTTPKSVGDPCPDARFRPGEAVVSRPFTGTRAPRP